MKKVLLLALIAMCIMFVGCQEESLTPQTDQTKLYPAMNPNTKKWGFIDNKGNFVIPARYDEASSFSCGYALVSLEDNWTFIDKNGAIQMTPKFDWADQFYYGYVTFGQDGYYGLMNTNFEITIQPHFEYLGWRMSHNGLIPAHRDEDSYYEYVNAQGETVIPAKFDWASVFIDDVAVVGIGNKYAGYKYGAINKSGEFTIQPTSEYIDMYPMGKGLVLVLDEDEKSGVLDKNGKMVVPTIYSDMFYEISDDMILYCTREGKWGYLNYKGEDVLNAEYYEALPFHEGKAWVKLSEDGKWFVIDKTGKTLFGLGKGEEPYDWNFEFYPITGFHNGLALIKTESGYKYVDESGKFIYEWSNDKNKSPEKMQSASTKSIDMIKELHDMTLHFDSRRL